MAERGHLFLSYSKKDWPFVRMLSGKLETTGHKVWIDTTDILGGVNWDASLASAIDSCSGFLPCITPSYIQSEVCTKELERAFSGGRHIIPLLVSALADHQKDWPLCIQCVHYIDFTDWEQKSALEAAMDRLTAALQLEQGLHGRDAERAYLASQIEKMDHKIDKTHYIELGARTVKTNDSLERDNFPPCYPRVTARKQARRKMEQYFPRGMAQKQGQREKEQFKNVLEALERYDKFALLGGGGSGKTTTLHYLASEMAKRRLTDPENEPLPFYLELSSWNDNHDSDNLEPIDFVRKQDFPYKQDLEPLLASGKIVLLLDGLNEMGLKGYTLA
ncbi:MAG: toll/interleukin-1 receptor domain-containing protein, partial [Desulfobacteraceae bacterium]